ncbi:MAG: filamentous hemagglutinin N-terminal domain-containing protein [Alphaproteobacteria bacterium]|nr:filamentous hemagglutinin N-terminal domain-containing protein [Alphaproteobacteria bacterium]
MSQAYNAEKSALRRRGTPIRRSLALFLAIMLFTGNVNALPAGGVVSVGNATIVSESNLTTVTQSSPNLVINWLSFSIGLGESVRYLQPSVNSVALNRVLGGDPSTILGSMTANGSVFLTNPNGVLIGKSAVVNVGALVASSLNISDADFIAQRYRFANDRGNVGTVVNQGTIRADGGYVALLGADVGNDGIITARLGTVALAAGNSMTLDVAGDGLLNVLVDQGAVTALIKNGGLIQADGGQVLLSAKTAGNLLQSAVNNTGVIQAQTIESRNGTIKLIGDAKSGDVKVGGTLDASGRGTGQTGGSVTVTGQHVGLVDQAKIDASGDVGGGTVLIGGDFQGKNPLVANAQAIYMGKDVVIAADALSIGDGGKVVLWSDVSTKAFGTISARGGALSGAGGLIETSGHALDIAGMRVDARAAQGAPGIWLLDPYNVTISGASALGAFSSSGGTDTWTPSASGSTVLNTDINDSLNAGTNVTIQTNGGGGGEGGAITVQAGATISRSTPGALTVFTLLPDQGVGGTITIGAAISGSAGAPLSLVLSGASAVSVAAPITTFGGNFSSTGTTFSNAGGTIATAGGKVDILHSTTVAVAAPVTTGGGSFTSTGSTFTNAAGAIDTQSATTIGGVQTITQSSTVTLAAPLTTSGADIRIGVGTTLTDTTQINAGAGTITIQPTNDATSIGVGTNTSTLIITNVEVNNMIAGTLVIGRATGTATINIGTSEAVDFGSKNVNIQQASGGMTFQTNSVQGSGGMTFIAGTGAFTNAVAINTTGAISITADDAGVSANIGSSTAGAVLLQSSTAAQPINVSSIAGGLNVTEAEVNFLRGSGANTGSLTIGSVAGLAAMNVATVGTPLVVVGSGAFVLSNGASIDINGPVSVSGTISAQTASGNLTLANSLSTTNATSSAIVLGAGVSTASGNATGGNVIVAGGSLSMGAGGRATLYSGSVADSTGLTNLVGSGSGNFRYNSTRTATNYTAPLGAGTFAVYREQPTLVITANSPAAIAYGVAAPALSAGVTSGLQNGDSAAQALSASATLSLAGPTSSSGNYTAGAHAITPSGASDQLGYALSYVNGSLAVTQLNTTISGTRTYDGSLTAPAANLGTVSALIGIDVVTVSGAGSVANKNVGAAKAVTNGTLALGGGDAGNYNLLVNGNGLTVTPAPLTIMASDAVKTYGQTLVLSAFTTPVAPVSGESVGSVTLVSPGAVAAASVGLSPYAITPSDATGGSFSAANYTITYVNGRLAVSAAPQTIRAGEGVKPYNQPLDEARGCSQDQSKTLHQDITCTGR